MCQVSHHGFVVIHPHSEGIQELTQSHFITAKGVPITQGIKGFEAVSGTGVKDQLLE